MSGPMPRCGGASELFDAMEYTGWTLVEQADGSYTLDRGGQLGRLFREPDFGPGYKAEPPAVGHHTGSSPSSCRRAKLGLPARTSRCDGD